MSRPKILFLCNFSNPMIRDHVVLRKSKLRSLYFRIKHINPHYDTDYAVWVSDYIDISDQDLEELAVKITTAGINVEQVITHHIDNLVIGKIINVEDHPDSDHLHVCSVDIGSDNVGVDIVGYNDDYCAIIDSKSVHTLLLSIK